jgi:hypothetical protein
VADGELVVAGGETAVLFGQVDTAPDGMPLPVAVRGLLTSGSEDLTGSMPGCARPVGGQLPSGCLCGDQPRSTAPGGRR